MCHIHQYCVLCFCLCTALSYVVSTDSEHFHKHIANGTATNASEPRDKKDAILSHHDIMTRPSPNATKWVGLNYIKLIFEKFGDKDHITKENLIKLFMDLEHAEINSAIDEHQEHVHSDENEDVHIENTTVSYVNKHHEDDKVHKHDHDADEHNTNTNSPGRSAAETSTNEMNGHSGRKAQDNLDKNRHKRSAGDANLGVNRTHCLDMNQLLRIYSWDSLDVMTPEQFLYLAPGVLYQLGNPRCKTKSNEHLHHDATSQIGFGEISAEAWGYSILAVIVISLVGLLGVAVIPIMQKVFYNHLLQFLVALAVGALTGDALLHLLPHALVGGHNHDDHSDSSHDDHGDEDNGHHIAVLKGLCGLSGLFFFFVMERVVTIFTNIKRKRKQSKRKTLSPKETTECTDGRSHVAKKLSAYDEPDYQSCEEMVMVVHPNKSLKGFADESHHNVFHTSHKDCHSKDTKPSHSNSHSNQLTTEEEGMLPDHVVPHSHSGHSHHAHCEMLTSSVASIAWMVILGDGIHNFCDGLAIGAGFADSITGGFSTSIAVFCHELPHEIGDFAVLLRAGMSVKQAVVYNLLSSLLCFVGMLIGVAIGNIDDASTWIFACVAGMFLYIAMVDMLPEMTAVDTKRGENPFCHLALQCSGMILGAGIMLVIAFYEEQLLSALGDH